MGGILGQRRALPAQGICPGAVGLGLSASCLLLDSSFPFVPPQKLKDRSMLTDVGLAGAPWLALHHPTPAPHCPDRPTASQ